MPKPTRILTLVIVVTAFTAVLVSVYFSQPSSPKQVLGLQACNQFTYSSWGSCLNGRQKRSVVMSEPQDCSGGNAVTERECNICTNFDYSQWSACTPDGHEYREVTAASPMGCTGGVPDLAQACDPGELHELRLLSSTTNPKEYIVSAAGETADQLKSQGYRIEGNLGSLYSEPEPQAQPLYDLRNNNGNHVFTNSDLEKDQYTQNGYTLQQVVGYVYSQKSGGLLPLYRLTSDNGNAIYTSNETAKATLTQYGYHLVTVLGYLSPSL